MYDVVGIHYVLYVVQWCLQAHEEEEEEEEANNACCNKKWKKKRDGSLSYFPIIESMNFYFRHFIFINNIIT